MLLVPSYGTNGTLYTTGPKLRLRLLTYQLIMIIMVSVLACMCASQFFLADIATSQNTVAVAGTGWQSHYALEAAYSSVAVQIKEAVKCSLILLHSR